MDKYKILYDLTQRGYQIIHKQQPQATRLAALYTQIIIIWDQMSYRIRDKGMIARRLTDERELLEHYGFTEQKLPQ